MSDVTTREILDMIEANGGPEGLDLSGRDLSGLDLGSETVQAEFPKAQGTAPHWVRRLPGPFGFMQKNPAGLNLTGANLQGANLTGARLEGAFLIRSNLAGANLTEANLQGAFLLGANLQGANLEEAKLQGAFLFSARTLETLTPLLTLLGVTFAGLLGFLLGRRLRRL